MVKFHETLSEQSVYHRYFSALKLSQRIAHERLTRICFIDYDREIALVAETRDAQRRADDPRRRPPEQAARHRTRRNSPLLVSDHGRTRGLAPNCCGRW